MPETKEPSKSPVLKSWNELIEDVSLPNDFALALMSGRPELLRIVNRPLSVEEARQVAHAMQVVMETNVALQRHCQEMADMVRDAYGNLKGLTTKLGQLEDHANFRQPLEDDEE